MYANHITIWENNFLCTHIYIDDEYRVIYAQVKEYDNNYEKMKNKYYMTDTAAIYDKFSKIIDNVLMQLRELDLNRQKEIQSLQTKIRINSEKMNKGSLSGLEEKQVQDTLEKDCLTIGKIAEEYQEFQGSLGMIIRNKHLIAEINNDIFYGWIHEFQKYVKDFQEVYLRNFNYENEDETKPIVTSARRIFNVLDDISDPLISRWLYDILTDKKIKNIFYKNIIFYIYLKSMNTLLGSKALPYLFLEILSENDEFKVDMILNLFDLELKYKNSYLSYFLKLGIINQYLNLKTKNLQSNKNIY